MFHDTTNDEIMIVTRTGEVRIPASDLRINGDLEEVEFRLRWG